MPDTVWLTIKELAQAREKGRWIHPAVKEAIREEVRMGKNRSDVAKKFNVPYPTVAKLAEGLSGYGRGNRNIGTRTMGMLKSILKDGYFIPNNSNSWKTCENYRTLRKYFNSIRKVRARGRSIIFIENRKEDTLKAFIEVLGLKRMDYGKLSLISSLFGVKLQKQDKADIIGKTKKRVMRAVAKRIPRQASVSDFLGRFLHSEVLRITITL
ncbi:MAG: hypothetical protein KAU24_01445 [Candidatus Aenigmarchaeota archaeon]|nr:hypothetical protein [Candidatus Aenigmarchaeota archaeon]